MTTDPENSTINRARLTKAYLRLAQQVRKDADYVAHETGTAVKPRKLKKPKETQEGQYQQESMF